MRGGLHDFRRKGRRLHGASGGDRDRECCESEFVSQVQNQTSSSSSIIRSGGELRNQPKRDMAEAGSISPRETVSIRALKRNPSKIPALLCAGLALGSSGC